MDAVIINRVSDRRQKDGYSLDAQDRFGTEYAKRHDFTIIKRYTFQETASKQSQRKTFQEFLSFIGSHPDKRTLAIVAEKSDRLGRNHKDKESLQELYLKGKIEVHLYKENKVFSRSSTATDIFMDDIMTSVGKYAALNIARESLKGMQEKCEQGWYPSKAPLGYKNISSTNSDGGKKRKILGPDPRTRGLVYRIFELRTKMLSYEAIRLQCIEEGLVPEGRLKTQSSIEKVLKNSFYGGTFRWRGTSYKGKHELIVPSELFATVQTTFAKAGRPYQKNRGIFSNWLGCSCGCKVTFDPKTKYIKATGETRNYNYYRCSNGKYIHQRLKYISEENIMERLGDSVSKITITEDLAKDISNALDETHRRVQNARMREIEGYKAALKSLENKEDEVYNDLKVGILDDMAYKRQFKRIRVEREQFTNLMDKAQRMIDGAYLTTAKKILELAKSAKSLWEERSKEERRDFLEKILSNRILDGATIRYELKKPFRIVSEMASSSNWRAQRESNPQPHGP